MKVTIAEHAGFCFGVERAIRIVNEAARNHEEVVTFGPIIHNPQVVQDLKESGVKAVDNISEINSGMTVVIRTHGIDSKDYGNIQKEAGVIDATCPFVKKVQDAVKKYSAEGISVVVVGEGDHPEVRSIVSFITGEFKIINSVEEAAAIEYRSCYGVVAQTTQNEEHYNRILKQLESRCGDLKVSRTICSATHNRQYAAVALAAKVDAMIVVGGRNSANTTRLYELCKDICDRTYHIETVEELTGDMFDGAPHVGISAGASTPARLVNQVKEYILERANEQ